MSEGEERLNPLLAQDAVPAHDARFRLTVLERIERRRMRNQCLRLAALGAAALVVAAAISPNLPLPSTGIQAGIFGVAAAAAIYLVAASGLFA